ncbi:MAG: hypothetical protein Crog4KO_11640 [Crocinitomicaceae bacterium]
MRHLLVVVLILLAKLTFAQVDFNNYTTLLSSGAIPEDFTERTYAKLEKDIASSTGEMNDRDRKEFYTSIHYTVDGLIHSGSVIYGDPITEYVEAVAKKLLVKDKALFRELRFYTLKSNATNAFATDQGIVFVTTGLLSQITSEAQLAFILAHEISHYQQEHVLDSYSYQRENRSASIEQMSVYSRDRELEADRLGLEMYARAGYAKDEVIPTFDVLLYSYLPFDEVQVPNAYFQNFDSLLVPEDLFPEAPYEIEAIEDEDDSRSSHPNIKTRKDRIQQEIDAVKNWQTDVFKLSEERFKEVRNIARFEVVRNDVHQAEYADALYAIYLLEKDFSESMFLQRMKAQSWLGILQYRLDNSIFSVVDRKSNLEGASANVHHFIKEMTKPQLIAFCIRNVASIHSKNPDDKEIQEIYALMIKDIANTDKFDLEDYYKISFQTAYRRSLPDTVVVVEDTVQTENNEDGLNKYDRIKGKKTLEDGQIWEGPDSTDFHLYLLPDLVSDQNFLDVYNEHHSVFLKQEQEREAYRKMTSKERYYYDQDRKKQRNIKVNEKIDYLISMEPIVIKYGASGVKYVKSEKTQEAARESIDIAADKAGLQVAHLDRQTMDAEGTQAYNDRCILMNYLEQSANNTDISSFPVDFQLVNGVQEKFGTSHVLFSVATHGYQPDFASLGTLYSLLFFPASAVYFPVKFFMGNFSEINMIVMNLENGEVAGALSHEFRSTLRTHIYGAHIYSLFNSFSNDQ